MSAPRQCFYIPVEQFDEHGYIPSLVIEGQPGHTPLMGNGTHAQPWYWGKTYDEAKKTCQKENERMGINAEDAAQIVLSSIGAGAPSGTPGAIGTRVCNANDGYAAEIGVMPSPPMNQYDSHTQYRYTEPDTAAPAIVQAPENKWYAIDDEPSRNGTPGGDYEVTDSWNVRLHNDALPGAVVDVDYYVERTHPQNSEIPNEPPEYAVSGMVSYTVCTDRSDPGGTETWADIQYDNDADPLAYHDIKSADEAARYQAERWIRMAAMFMAWDGEPFYE